MTKITNNATRDSALTDAERLPERALRAIASALDSGVTPADLRAGIPAVASLLAAPASVSIPDPDPEIGGGKNMPLSAYADGWLLAGKRSGKDARTATRDRAARIRSARN